MRIAPELAHLVSAEERRDAASQAQYERDMEFLRAAGLKEPEPEPGGIDGFKARMEAQARAEAVAEERANRIAHENPDAPVADPLRDFAKRQQADRGRLRRRVPR